MMKANPTCIKCGTDLTEENWYSSRRKKNGRICKVCDIERTKQWKKANPEKATTHSTRWQKANPEKAKAMCTMGKRKRGIRSFSENKECSSFLGIHVAERVLSHVFKNVERMPMNNSGFDFVCNKGKKIDVKSSCLRKDGVWAFHINHNTTADYFLCLAFDNREDLNPLHAWLLPGAKVNHLVGTGIRQSTIYRWDEYRLDTSKINTCCDTMKVI